MQTFQQFLTEMARIPSIKASIKSQMSNAIGSITKGFHDHIPLQAIFDILEKHGYQPVQEDGTPWSGFLLGGAECGSEEAKKQRAMIGIIRKEDNAPMDNALVLMWCKMQSGRYEVVSYIS